MALTICPDCQAEISDQAPVCPRCGRPMATTKTAGKKKVNGNQLAAGVLLMALGIGAYLVNANFFLAIAGALAGVVGLVLALIQLAKIP